MTNSGRSIPRGIKIIFHIGVVSKEFPIGIKASVKNITVTGRYNLPVLTVGRDFINDAGRGETISIMPPTIRHARKKVILSPVHWHTGTVCFHRSGVISCY